jgi:uracil phosphoribosyltransferase
MTGAAVTWAPNALLLLLEAVGASVWLASSAGVVTVVKPVVDSKVVEDSVIVVTRGEVETRSVEKAVLSVVMVLTAVPSEETVVVKVSVETAVEMVEGAALVAVGAGSVPVFRAAEPPWQ